MIIDVNQIAGLDAYLKNDDGTVNLAAHTPASATTPELLEKQQMEIMDLDLLIEADNLLDLLPRQNDPLFRIEIQKEILPGIFADPYQHRVHTLAGFEDFNRGSFENCRAFDIDGIPTLVSVGTGTCEWTSRWYELPRAVDMAHINWELAGARTAAAQSYTYTIEMEYRKSADTANTTHPPIQLATGIGPDKERAAAPAGLSDIIAFRYHFSADVTHDSYLHEQHLAVQGESLGSPLLRAINVLERVPSPLSFTSLHELMSAADTYQLIEQPGQPPKTMLATVGLNASLIGKKDQDTTQDRYEFLRLQLTSSAFTRFEARLNAEAYMRTTNE